MRPAVWAPRPKRVDLVVEGRRTEMDEGEDGWWRSDLELEPGADYAFSLDGGPARPDPRSRHQPAGVHGASRVVHTARPGHGNWRGFDLPSAVLYELHIGTFTPSGTFAAAGERLAHLVDLGVDAVEVMPVNHFPGNHGWGYDGVALFAVHDAYGGPAGFQEFVDACHSHGLGVVLDVVYNHLGPDGNYLAEFGPYFTELYRTPWGEAVNLDGPGSDQVRRFFIDNALMWLGDYGVDGLRLDAVHALLDRSAVHFLEELSTAVDALERRMGRPLFLIAESDLNDPRLLWDPARGGYGLEATWNDDFHHAVHAAVTGETDGYYQDFGRLTDVAKALESAYVYTGDYSRHRERSHGRPADGLSGSRFLGYVQNHDQVGNRARGERLGHLVDGRLVELAAALLLTSPFVPMLFQGEEWSASSPFPYFSDHQDTGLAEAVREGRRREFAAFGWDPADVPDPQDADTFRSAKLDWSEIGVLPHQEVLGWYRALTRLRRQTPDLTDDRLDRVRTFCDEDQSTLWVQRGNVVVAANFSDHPRSVEVGGLTIDLTPAGVAITELLQ